MINFYIEQGKPIYYKQYKTSNIMRAIFKIHQEGTTGYNATKDTNGIEFIGLAEKKSLIDYVYGITQIFANESNTKYIDTDCNTVWEHDWSEVDFQDYIFVEENLANLSPYEFTCDFHYAMAVRRDSCDDYSATYIDNVLNPQPLNERM
jgi:hypothetical protein